MICRMVVLFYWVCFLNLRIGKRCERWVICLNFLNVRIVIRKLRLASGFRSALVPFCCHIPRLYGFRG